MRAFLRPIAILAMLATLPTPARAQAMRGQPTLPDAVLATLRGGFDLKGGLSIAIGVTTDTRIDSRLVVRSTYTLDRDAAHLQVSARGGDDVLTPIALDTNGAAIATADGSVRLRGSGSDTQVQFSGSSIDVTNLIGRTLGSVVANSGNNRTIDVATTIDINIAGISADRIGSSMVQVGDLALDSTRQLNR